MSDLFDIGFEAASTKPLVAPPTVRQIAFIVNLRTEYSDLAREACSFTGKTFVEPAWINPTTRETTSLSIERGLATNKTMKKIVEDFRSGRVVGTASTPAPSTVKRSTLSEGMWVIGTIGDPDARIFKIQVAVHGSGRLYAKELIDNRFEYVQAMGEIARHGRRLALEEAKSYGQLYGTCCLCGRTLTDETSIENGIGPVCAKKF